MFTASFSEPDCADVTLGGQTTAGVAEDAQYYRRVLHELVDMGTELARAVHRQGMAEPSPEMAAAFDRVGRCVRRSIALARQVAEPLPVRRDPAQMRAAARRQVIRTVEDTIQREARDGEADGLRDELRERLDAPEFEDDIASRPVAEIIAEIVRDLGLTAPRGTHPWQRRAPADLAALSALAARSPAVATHSAARPGAEGSGPVPLDGGPRCCGP